MKLLIPLCLIVLNSWTFIGCTGSSSAPEAPPRAAGVTDEVIELPDPEVGKFTGTYAGARNSQFAHAIVTKKGKIVSISFSGGKARPGKHARN